MSTLTWHDAISDINESLEKYHLAATFGWQDVAQRYRRSRMGAFWLTINMGVMIGALGFIFGALFHAPMHEFLPFICAGMIIWGYISTCVSEGCTSFISAEGIILQVRMPLFTHLLRTLYRNAIIFAHNIVIFPIVLVGVGGTVSWSALWAIPGFLLLTLNLLWMMLVLSIICARFRDMTQVIQNVMQVMFYATPLMWLPRTLPEGVTKLALEANPFYHLVSLVRTPLLGSPPTSDNWMAALILLVVGWTFALLFFSRFRHRIAYWL